MPCTAGLALEEMAVYAANNRKQDSYLDVLVRAYKGNIEIDFRSIGEALDPMQDAEGDISSNVQLLRGIATSIQTEYTMGMNVTRIVVPRQV